MRRSIGWLYYYARRYEQAKDHLSRAIEMNPTAEESYRILGFVLAEQGHMGEAERVLREAMRIANGHLDYLDYLLDHRRWLAGAGLSLADFTAAAQLSVVDYLGAVDWRGHKQTKDWYAVMKSRPAFRPLLGERMEVIVPPAHYDKVDF